MEVCERKGEYFRARHFARPNRSVMLQAAVVVGLGAAVVGATGIADSDSAGAAAAATR